jgi:hypothetical protein
VGELKELLPENLNFNNCQLFTFDILSYDAEIVGFCMFGDHEKGILTSYPLLQVRDPYNYEITFPYIHNDTLSCKLILLNELSYDINEGVMVSAVDNSGNVVETTYLNTKAFERSEIAINTLFSEETLETLNNIKVKSVKFIIPNLEIYSLNGKYFEIIPPDFQ